MVHVDDPYLAVCKVTDLGMICIQTAGVYQVQCSFVLLNTSDANEYLTISSRLDFCQDEQDKQTRPSTVVPLPPRMPFTMTHQATWPLLPTTTIFVQIKPEWSQLTKAGSVVILQGASLSVRKLDHA
jgi:hypothetical protein